MSTTEITNPDALLAVGVETALADLLISRTRTILWISVIVGLTFLALELALAPRLSGPFYVKCVGILAIGMTLVLLRRSWVAPHAVAVAMVIVLGGTLLTALSGMVSPSREYETTAILFAVGSLTMATLLPWGLWPQAVTVLFGATLLCAAVVRADGNLYVLLEDPAAAVAFALMLSILTAHEMQRYRLTSMRELVARRQAELEIRALNADLERRVMERTRELEAANEQLHGLSMRLQSVREEERTRISREIHDELGQMLTALKIDIDLLPKRIAEGTGGPVSQVVRQRLATMSELANTMLHSVRRISTTLRPSVLDDLGLVTAIEWQAREFEKRSGVRCAVNCEPREVSLDPPGATALFRIVQEALTNVARHADATKISITLREEGSNFVLEVADDGRGATEAELRGARSLGLLGIRERARLLGGDVDIHGVSGQGTTVLVRIPRLQPAEAEEGAARAYPRR
jgi:signal transduction histidine kinase